MNAKRSQGKPLEVVPDYYCENHSNPFKMGYAELWYAWRPVHTDTGWKWLTKVHRTMFGQRYLKSVYYIYTEHKETTS